MTFARWRNGLTTHFSGCIPIFKRRISVPVSPSDFANLKRHWFHLTPNYSNISTGQKFLHQMCLFMLIEGCRTAQQTVENSWNTKIHKHTLSCKYVIMITQDTGIKLHVCEWINYRFQTSTIIPIVLKNNKVKHHANWHKYMCQDPI